MKVALKKATVKEFLTAAEKLNEFMERQRRTNALESDSFRSMYDDLYQKEEEKALDLYAESGENISHFTFMSLADACYDVLGPVVEVREKYCKILQILGVEVTE